VGDGDKEGSMAVAEVIKFTYEDYLLMEEEKRYEIIDGRRYMVPAPTPYHQWISARLEKVLRSFVETRGLGFVFDAPCDVVLSPTDIVQPDILFIAKGRRGSSPNAISGACLVCWWRSSPPPQRGRIGT
jgi:Uma2 family endonuclease